MGLRVGVRGLAGEWLGARDRVYVLMGVRVRVFLIILNSNCNSRDEVRKKIRNSDERS